MGSSNVTVPRWIQSRLGGPRRVSVGLCCWCCADGTLPSPPLWRVSPGAWGLWLSAARVWSVGGAVALAGHGAALTWQDDGRGPPRCSVLDKSSLVGNITISKSNGVVCSHVQLYRLDSGNRTGIHTPLPQSIHYTHAGGSTTSKLITLYVAHYAVQSAPNATNDLKAPATPTRSGAHVSRQLASGVR